MLRPFTKIPLLLLAGFFSYSCQKATRTQLFMDLPAEKTGIYFANRISNAEDFNMIDYLYYYDGGGVAIGDINNDGLSDIYLVSNEGDNALYLNQGDMSFRDISESAGVKSPGLWKTGVSMADVNGDGLLDIYQCRLGNYKGVRGKNQLYINQGDLTFREEAENYNLDFSGFSTQAAFFDLENDGDLDVYLLNHSVHTQNSFGDASLRQDIDSLAGDRIYKNDNGNFIDISPTAGIYRSQLGYGLGIGLSDINDDGFTDIFIANDFMENDFLYLNNRDGTFTEVYQQMVDYTSLSSMGCDLADFNNDGLVDIITLDMLPEQESIRKATVGEDPLEIFNMKMQLGYMPQYKRNTLQLNRGNGTFSEIAMLAGIHATDWSWAPLFADFDNDGWKDLFISNGIKGRPNDLNYLEFINSDQVLNNAGIADSVLFNHMPGGKVSNYFYRNNKDLTFENVSSVWGITPHLITQGVAYADLDNDGDLDLVLNNLDTLATVKENTLSPDSTTQFLELEFLGAEANTRAIGTKVEVYCGDRYQLYEQYPVRGFKSTVDSRMHIGLGSAAILDSVLIRWPGGSLTRLYGVKSNKIIKLTEPDKTTPVESSSISKPLFTQVTNAELGIEYLHQENIFIEFNREPLIPHMHSTEGPALAVADINGDGLDDFFIGGAKHQPGSIYVQTEFGFKAVPQPALAMDQVAEDVDACFFDFDRDGDQDLIVVSGGNEFQGDSPHRKPRLYINDGGGIFTTLPGIFDMVNQTGSCVAVYDFDADGWQDLFLGSLVEPWNYGISPQSYLLKNATGKSLIDVSGNLPNQGFLGMINDAAWIDLNGNVKKSLVLAGEWMDISIITTDGETSQMNTIPESSGWWKAISYLDYDGDGDLDLLAGNLGLNSKLKASTEAPLNLYLDDFDQNGKLDAVMTIIKGNREYIFHPQAILERQIPSIASNLPGGVLFSEASASDVFGNKLSAAEKLSAVELRSGVFLNEDSGFHFLPFPNIMQISFIQDFLTGNFIADESMEIIHAGNLWAASMEEGRYTADRGSIMTGLPGDPKILSIGEAGIMLQGDIRRLDLINFRGDDLIMAASNNDSIKWFRKR